MTVVDKLCFFEPVDNVIGQKGIQVIRDKELTLSGQQEEKQPDVVFSVKKWPFVEEQSHPMHLVVPVRKGRAVLSDPSHKQDLESQFGQDATCFIDPLIGNKVVNHRNYSFFQSTRSLTRENNKFTILPELNYL